MRLIAGCIALCGCLGATLAFIPQEDSRYAETRGFRTHFRFPQYASREDWEAHRARLRKQILSAAGLLPMPARGPLNPRVVRHIAHRDYAVEAVLLETLPGYYLGGNLYLPMDMHPRAHPGVLLPHGHWSRGRLENLPTYSVRALGINLARQGYIAFAYDMVGYNDTRQTPHDFGGSGAEQLWSFNPMGLQLWNSTRALDYLESLPGVAPGRLAVTGASGGGTQTFLLAAVDDRIGFAAPVNMVSASMQGGDPCEEAPNLRLGTFNVEFAAMMAPRPMLLISDTSDWTRNTPREEFPAIRNIYELYGKGGEVANAHIDAEHNYNRESREALYRYLARYMPAPERPPGTFSELPFRTDSDADMLALPNGRRPEHALDYRGVWHWWREMARSQVEKIKDRGELRELLSFSLGAEWPEAVVSVGGGERFLLSRADRGDRVPALWIEGTGAPALVVHPEGLETARREPVFAEMRRAGRPVLAINAFQTASARAPRNRWDRYWLSYNQTDDANRVQDIMTALRFLETHARGVPEVFGVGRAGVWCLFAAAAAPIDVRLTADLDGFAGTDADFLERFMVPGIQRAGGLQTALRLLPKIQGRW